MTKCVAQLLQATDSSSCADEHDLCLGMNWSQRMTLVRSAADLRAKLDCSAGAPVAGYGADAAASIHLRKRCTASARAKMLASCELQGAPVQVQPGEPRLVPMYRNRQLCRRARARAHQISRCVCTERMHTVKRGVCYLVLLAHTATLREQCKKVLFMYVSLGQLLYQAAPEMDAGQS